MNTWPEDELNNISRAGLYRRAVPVDSIHDGRVLVNGESLVDFASNDYLGFSHRKELKDAASSAVQKWGCGSRASRLMSGSLGLFDRLERKIAEFQGTEASICLGNGYIANSTVIPSLAGRGDVIFLDRSCHASMVDGALLSGARFFRFHHNDMEHLHHLLEKRRADYRRALILAESVYSMDGDMAPMEKMLALKNNFDCILVADEAHALGMFGAHGEGIISSSERVKPEIIIGTFGKALGSYGAFAACTEGFRKYLVNRCRGFIFSTALPPAVTAANLKALEVLPHTAQERQRVLRLADDLRAFIEKRLKKKTCGSSQIVPLILEDIRETVDLERYLMNNGIFVRAIRPPSVPQNAPRIRFSITADHEEKDLLSLKNLLASFFTRRKR